MGLGIDTLSDVAYVIVKDPLKSHAVSAVINHDVTLTRVIGYSTYTFL